MDSETLALLKQEKPFFHLKQATHFSFLIMKRALETHPEIAKNCPKLTPVQTLVLRHLMMEDGMSQAELAELSGKDNPGMTRILDNMEKQGIIFRRRSVDDRRVSNVFLTEKAKEIFLMMEPLLDELMMVIFGDFSLEEIEQFGSLCRRIMENCRNEIEKTTI